MYSTHMLPLTCFFCIVIAMYGFDPFGLPLLPHDFDVNIEKAWNTFTYNRPVDKNIPRNLWIGFREIPPPEKMYVHTASIIADCKKNNWTINLFDQLREEKFMSKYYRRTSLYYAYNLIHKNAKAAAGDIWRYAALYAFGGFYIDDDAFIAESVEKVILANDTVLLAKEGLEYEECYTDTCHLSINYQNHLHNISNATADMYDRKSIVQWAMFFEPRSVILYEVLKNIVELVKAEYQRSSFLMDKLHQHRIVICVTGPMVLSASIRELFLNQTFSSNHKIRIVDRDFQEYGGIYKVEGFVPYSRSKKRYENFYWHMRRKRIPLLSEYTSKPIPSRSPPPTPQLGTSQTTTSTSTDSSDRFISDISITVLIVIFVILIGGLMTYYARERNINENITKLHAAGIQSAQ